MNSMRRYLPVACFVAAVLLGARSVAAAEADAFADNACVQCHRDLPGRSSAIVDLEWKHSVHYENKVGCEGCHGGNAAVRREHFRSDEEFKRAAHLERNPEFLVMNRGGDFISAARGRSVSYFCGKCHMKIKEQHLGSPHGEFGDPTCTYCHGGGSHRITKAGIDIIDTRGRADMGRCSPCHKSATMEAVGRVKQTLADTEERIRVSGEQYKQLEALGYRNLELERLHHHTAEVRSQVRQIFHSFNMREIANFTAEIDGVADRTTASLGLVHRLRTTQRQQTAVGSMAVLLLLSFAGLLVYYKNTFLSHGPSSARTMTPHAGTRVPEAGPAGPNLLPSARLAAVGEVISMSDDREAREPEQGSFGQLAVGLAMAHFLLVFVLLASGAIGARTDGGEAVGVMSSIAMVLCWPLMPLGHLLVSDQSPVLWALMFANSAVWGLGVAGLAGGVKWVYRHAQVSHARRGLHPRG